MREAVTVRINGAGSRAGRALLLAAIVLGVLLLDQSLKSWCDGNMKLFERRPLLGQELLVLSRVYNEGIIGLRFSAIPPGYKEPYTTYFPTAVLVALFVSGFFLARVFPERRWLVAFSLLAAGSLSNLYDNWRQNHVVDSLQIAIGPSAYLPFNLADVAITTGGLTLIFGLARMLMREPSARP